MALKDETMLHRFGEDPCADARWLTFLDHRQCPVPVQRELLRAGITPDTLLAAPIPGVATDLSLLRSTLAAATPREWVNAVDPGQSVALVTLADEAYPPLLKLCDDAPPALFVAGDVRVLSRPAVAIVGARKASPMGLGIAREFAEALTATGLVVASGLALGIDGAAHAGALAAGGAGIAVMPTGVDTVYPRRHGQLARELASRGAVVSEFCPGTAPRKENFPRRNRTLSGLTLGTLVVEAGRPSGSLITAGAAAEQGREVLAVPWSIRHRGGAGCLHLLSQGASLACEPADVVMQIAPGLAARGIPDLRRTAPAALSRQARQILNAMGDEWISLDRLSRAAGMSADQCQQQLSLLEIERFVTRDQGMWIRSDA